MSLISVKEDIKASLRSARQSILGRGGEISLTAGMKDLPDAIYKIPADASLAFRTDDSMAYQKIVPSGAEEFAQVSKIGGMSYKSNNLFGGVSKTENIGEITAVFNYDGTIVLNGSGHGEFHLFGEDASGVLTFANLPDDLSMYYLVLQYSHYIEEEEHYDDWEQEINKNMIAYLGGYEISLSVSGTFNNFTLYLMHNAGSAPLPYEPFYEGLRDTKVTELVSEGAQLIPFPYVTTSQVYKGVNFTINDDGSVTCNGTATDDGGFNLINTSTSSPKVLLSGTYTLSGLIDGSSGTYYLQPYVDGSSKSTVTDSPRTYTVNGILTRLSFFFKTGAVFNNFTFYPMLNRGTTAVPYKPYRADAVDTFPISAELRAFLEEHGYGRGVNAENNYIDFERKVFVQNVGEVDMGTLSWGYRLSNNRHIFVATNIPNIQGQISSNIPINAIAKDYRAVTVNATWVDRDMSYRDNVVGQQMIEIVDNRYTDANTFKEAVRGKKLIYALAEPIETDISAYLDDDNFIEVEGGGTITAVNEHERAVPSTLKYTVKTGG